jgi:hypothetical protein
VATSKAVPTVHILGSCGFDDVAPPWGLFEAPVPSRAFRLGEGSFAGPYNTALEPARPTVGCYSVAVARGSARAVSQTDEKTTRISCIGVVATFRCTSKHLAASCALGCSTRQRGPRRSVYGRGVTRKHRGSIGPRVSFVRSVLKIRQTWYARAAARMRRPPSRGMCLHPSGIGFAFTDCDLSNTGLG